MTYKELKDDLFDKVKHEKSLVLDKFDELLKAKISPNFNENYTKLLKQLSYDFLVEKRREYENIDLDGCKNPAKFPKDNSPFDKTNHIDCLTAWTEDWEDVTCNKIEFKYLKNLDANIVILGKDSSGQLEHKNDIEKFRKNHTINDKLIREYVNKKIDSIDEKAVNFLNVYRFGFSPNGVRTNNMLRTFCKKYLNEEISRTGSGVIEPKENKNIFFTNSFVFLSAGKRAHSYVPDKIFEKSTDEFIVPLLDIIKPKIVIQGGEYAVDFVNKSLSKICNNEPSIINKITNFGKSLEDIHKQMLENDLHPKSFLYNTDWNKKSPTYFIPVYHPSYVRYYNKNEQCGHLVWEHIKKILDMVE